MEERIIPIGDVPEFGRRTNKWSIVIKRVLEMPSDKALSMDIPEHQFSQVRQALSHQKRRLGGFDYRLTKGILYLWKVEQSPEAKEKI